jgi:hypothetical protein
MKPDREMNPKVRPLGIGPQTSTQDDESEALYF